MKSTIATWHTSLDCECPYCNYYQNIENENSSQDWIVNVGERKKLNTLEDKEDFQVTCEKCKKEFCISETEY